MVNVTIQYVNTINDTIMTSLYMDYVELVLWYPDNYGLPVFVNQFNGSLLVAPLADVVLFALIYDIDNSTTEITVTIFYSNDSFVSDNRSFVMVYSSTPDTNQYNFTYTWTGEENISYEFYYVAQDGYYTVPKYNPTAGSYYVLSWDVRYAPVIVAWFDSTLLIDPYADLLFYCTIYDLDTAYGDLNVTLWYSVDVGVDFSSVLGCSRPIRKKRNTNINCIPRYNWFGDQQRVCWYE